MVDMLFVLLHDRIPNNSYTAVYKTMTYVKHFSTVTLGWLVETEKWLKPPTSCPKLYYPSVIYYHYVPAIL